MLAEKQRSFNEAVDRVTREKDAEIADLKSRLQARETTDTASQTTDTNLASGKIERTDGSEPVRLPRKRAKAILSHRVYDCISYIDASFRSGRDGWGSAGTLSGLQAALTQSADSGIVHQDQHEELLKAYARIQVLERVRPQVVACDWARTIKLLKKKKKSNAISTLINQPTTQRTNVVLRQSVSD